MLYIIRHGITDWNNERRLQGQTDIPLNDEGREMAEQARKEYRNVHFDICFCSPLARARETAEILLRDRDVPVMYDDRLKEMCFGIYEGAPNTLGVSDAPVGVFFSSPELYTDPPEGAESITALMERTGEFIKDRVRPELDAGRDVLIVGHGAMNSAIVCRIKDRPLSQFWDDGIPNCKLMRLI
ncbi:MAG: histidine phosphatase family protein [Lachnospiraceae bacterium]|nr:histidine phosphatase family protein [Lachnospiraceae bacterium]